MDLDDAPRLAVADYGALPTDVLHDVLLRLPADKLCRLRLVCRSWRSLTSDPLFARAHSSRHPPHAVVLRHRSNEVRVVGLHGRIVKRIPIGQCPGEGLSTHGDLACVSHGWGLAYVLNLATGAVVADVAVESRSKVNAEKPMCVLGHVPSTGEYKLLRIQNCAGGCAGVFSTRSLACEVMTLGGDGGVRNRRWRKRPRPPALISTSPLSSWSMAVVAGVAYFLLHPQDAITEPDRIAVFDMATEVWKPTTIQGPSSTIILAATSTGEEELMYPICRRYFRLARLNERLVTVYCNLQDVSTELWVLVDTEESLWTKLYTLQGTQFGYDDYDFFLHYHYPLAVLDDGRIVVWVDRTGVLRAYDPRTSTWDDLAWMDGDVVMHQGSLLCPNLGVQP